MENRRVYDMIIIGSGPAGLAAAIYAARAELDFTVLERNGISGGQVLSTYEVDNYPGLPGVSGAVLSEEFRKHCEKLKAPFEATEVLGITKGEDGIFALSTDDGRTLLSRTVIAACGAEHRELNVPGEEELQGMGVSYCATCDGAFFKGRTTAVIGGGDVALEDAVYLSRLCSKVYLFHRRDEFRASKSLVTQAEKCSNIEFVFDTVVKEICGSDMVESLITENTKTGHSGSIKVDGVFIAVGIKPQNEVITGLAACNEGGYVIAGEDCATSVPGLFVAGDLRTKALRQIITAAADGANAVTSAITYLRQ